MSYFKPQNVVMLKCCTQYISKFEKFSSGHRTGEGHFSFQFQRRAVPKNVQTLPYSWGVPGSLAGRICLQCWRSWFDSWVGKIHWRRDRLPTPVFLGFPDSSAGKESTCNVGDLGLFPGLGRFPKEWKGYPLQYSGLENSMDCVVHGVTKSHTQFSLYFTSPYNYTHFAC